MIQGLGMENGTKVTREIVAKNPGWTKDTTRFEIWDKIAQVAASKQIYIHPDVHVGKAQWCCNNTGRYLNVFDRPNTDSATQTEMLGSTITISRSTSGSEG